MNEWGDGHLVTPGQFAEPPGSPVPELLSCTRANASEDIAQALSLRRAAPLFRVRLLWRLAGVDHMHVHGLAGKFSQSDAEVIASARDCYTPLAEGLDDAVMPAFSSGQWAGTVAPTWAAVGRDDLLFMAGGGILAHPGGPAAGVASIRQAWAAARAGQTVQDAARQAPELAAALQFFGPAQ